MSFGRTAARRRQAAQVHASRLHKCPRCGREILGNGYYTHKAACIRDYAKQLEREDSEAMSPQREESNA